VNTEPNIKHRVTGALVLIALAVIFLPLILDGQKKNQILESNIPAKPVTGEIILLDIEKSENIANEQITKEQVATEQEPQVIDSPKVKEVVVNTTKEPKMPVKKPVTKPTATPKVKPVVTTDQRKNRPKFKSSALVIQVGSFSNKANAQKIVDKIKAAGYKAYLKTGKSNAITIHRVLVGPELKREKAESQLKALNKLSGLEAIVLAYDPLRH